MLQILLHKRTTRENTGNSAIFSLCHFQYWRHLHPSDYIPERDTMCLHRSQQPMKGSFNWTVTVLFEVVFNGLCGYLDLIRVNFRVN